VSVLGLPDSRVPRAPGWVRAERSPRWQAWRRGRFLALSTLDEMELPDGSGRTGPTWLVSISRRGTRRPTDEECRRVLSAFGLAGAAEDNHENGIARKFWMPVDPAERRACECKETEEQVVEPDGYTWSRKRA